MRLFLLSTLLNVCGFVKIHGEIYLNHPSVPYYQVQPYYQQYYQYSIPINYSPPKIIGASIQFTPLTNKFAHNRHLHWFKKLKKIKKKGVKYLKKYLASGCISPIKFKIIKKHDFKLQPNLRGNNAMPYGFGTEYFPQKETQKSNYSTIYIPVQANSNKTVINKQITPVYNSNMDIRSKINTASNSTVNKNTASSSANNWIPLGFAEDKKRVSS